ncbi:acyl-CoA dehydrogenase [Halorientalis sp. IM1011]|uniref:acyl-CoA dehydrogenase family protein n=1 Tax=Halorientalis sp. IM1011 TaxID=1932360 RepID=UPI00097CC24B|nr:acyl-CoA dehydrogenase family protein [Halorientalis sp. IM1011]AQL41945.1 acyl-CoA dehydrogenase [Halorientalis sp. IM1011]
MQFDKTHEMFRDSLRDYLESEIAPDVQELDKQEMTKEEAVGYLRDLRKLGIGFDQETAQDYFGDLKYYVIGSEEIARVWPSLNVMLNMSFPAMFANWASEETQNALGDKLEKGEAIGALGVTEPGSGSHSSRPNTVARKDGDEYVINGEKTWVSNAQICDLTMIVAWDEENDAQDMFIVDQENSPFDTRKLDKLGWKGSPTGQMFFDDVRVPEDNKLSNAIRNLILEHGDLAEALPFPNEMVDLFLSHKPLNAIFSFMRTGMAAMAVGIQQAAYEDALDYATDRETFGKPIAQHQMVQERLYEMKANVETSRLLTHEAVEKLANADEESRLYSSLAKGYACDKSVETARHGVELYGGNGLSTDYPLERYYRDAQTMTIPDGTEEIMKLIVGYEMTDMSAYA